MRPDIAGWSSLVARRAHNPEVVGSNPAPATKSSQALRGLFSYPSIGDGSFCMDNYRPGENCWFLDDCNTAIWGYDWEPMGYEEPGTFSLD